MQLMLYHHVPLIRNKSACLFEGVDVGILGDTDGIRAYRIHIPN